MTDRPHIRLEMLSNPMYLAGARELVASVAKRLGYDEVTCCQIALAVDEALCNVIRHGYDRQSDRPIWLSIWPIEPDGESAGLRIVIEDEAKQVDLDRIKGRELDDVRPGGLGVHIIKEVMNEVLYEKRDGTGMRLTMVKSRPDRDAVPQAPSESSGGGST